MRHTLVNRLGLRTVLHDRYRVRGYDGLSAPPRSSSITRYPGQSGQRRGLAVSPSRPLEVQLSTRTRDLTSLEAERAYLNTNYNRNTEPFTYEVELISGQVLALREVHLEDGGLPLSMDFARLLSGSLVFDLALVADDPWWYDPITQQETFVMGEPGGITVPLVFPLAVAPEGIYSSRTIRNAGTINAWPRIELVGPGLNPSVENLTTGERFALTYELQAGELVVIEMDPDPKRRGVTSQVGGGSLTAKRTADSRFWALPPGDSQVRVAMNYATSGSASIGWANRFEGI